MDSSDNPHWEKEKEIILTTQRCQRNWDYTKTISEGLVNELVWIAQNAPSKQHEAYYDMYYTTDRAIILDLYQSTWGHTQTRNPPSNARNSQMNANMYMVFVCKQPPTVQNTDNDGSPSKKDSPARWENGIVSIGIALGLVMSHAARNGLVTGCNKSHSTGPDADYYWEKRLGIYDDVVKHKTKKILYGVGIGYPQDGKHRWESDDTELCIGAGNGYNLTGKHPEDLDFEEVNPYNNKKYRRCKIVDIRSNSYEVDPYGEIHSMPSMIESKPYSDKPRDIRCIKIK